MSAAAKAIVVVVANANDAQAWADAAAIYGEYAPPSSLTSESAQRVLVGEARADVPQLRRDELDAIRDAVFMLQGSVGDATFSQELAERGKRLEADYLIILGQSDVLTVDVARRAISKIPRAGDLLRSLKTIILAAAAPPGGTGSPTNSAFQPHQDPPPEKVEDLTVTDPLPTKGPETFDQHPIDVQRGTGAPPPPPPGPVPEKVEDLTAKDPLPTKGPETFEQRPIDVQRENVRGAIAISLVGALILTIILFLLGDMFDHPVDGTKLNAAMTALVGLVGSVTGFYFGSQASSQAK